MSIASAIQTLTNTIRGIATTKGQIKSAVNTDIDFINNEQIEQYPNLIKNAIKQYKSYIPVVTAEGKQLSLNTVPLKMKEFAEKGDTFQQRYEGKNFVDFINSSPYIYVQGLPTGTQDSPMTNKTNNSYTITYNRNSFIGVLSNIMNLKPNTGYTISFNRVQNSNFSQRLHILNVSEQGEYSANTTKNSGVYGTPYTLTFTTGETGKIAIMISVSNSSPSGNTETITNIQVEEGSTKTEFEPFVGGIQAPNPLFPQPIQVVTGEQTVHIGNIELPLSLGDMEICRIGPDYDKFFKNTLNSPYYNAELELDSWYKFETIFEHIFSGSTNDNYGYNTDLTDTLAINLYPLKKENPAKKYNSLITPISVYCDKFRFSVQVTDFEHIYVTGGIAIEDGYIGNLRLYIAHSRLNGYSSSLTNNQKRDLVKTWLQSNPIKVKYITANPIYTKITDTTLINQLEAINNTVMNNGTTVIYADNETGLQPTLYVEAYAKAE